ncbi:MAG: hypothetical protein QY318_02765 [Candidatus Dojkabacteria bacterium]|nr:MAG: hypothetical protein QY318_02765 [Candidatus Dojkabacteria bacterium]
MVDRIYKIYKFAGKIARSRALNSALVLVATFGLGLEVVSPIVYAQDGEGNATVDAGESYTSGTAVIDTLTESEGVTDSANLAQNQATDFAIVALSITCMECLENADDVAANPNIHPSAKTSLLTLVDNNNRQMLTNPPTQNLYAHMQTQWMPGETYANRSVYAQSGYDLLISTGIDQLWENVRNVAYVIFVLVLIVAGFMMMFRQKIGGQLAVTVFNTIPQVIICLILVTFSFAIVGLVLNLSATLTNVAAGILGLADPTDGVTATGPLSVFSAFISGNIVTVGAASVTTIVTTVAGSILANSGIAALGIAASPLAGGTLAIIGLVGILIVLVILGIVLVGSVKVWITLLKAYVGILIDTILAPLYLTMSALPGRSQMRGDWFRRILKNALTFTVVFFFLNLAAFVFNANINLGFPTSLAEGQTAPVGSGPVLLAWLLKGAVSIYLVYVAAEAPKFLEEFLPQTGGKSVAGALQSAAKGAFGKLPIVGGMMG